MGKITLSESAWRSFNASEFGDAVIAELKVKVCHDSSHFCQHLSDYSIGVEQTFFYDSGFHGKNRGKKRRKKRGKKVQKMLQYFSRETLIIYNVAPPLAPPDFFDTFSGFYLSLRSFLMQLGSICRFMWVVLDTAFSL